MGLDATKPVEYEEHVFTKVRIPGEDEVDLDAVVNPQHGLALDQMFAE
jgi:2,5-furandicarboxylate decarboxylase 1